VYTDLLGIQGWEIQPDGIDLDAEVIVRIRPRMHLPHSCHRCRKTDLPVYDRLPTRLVRDFPIWGRRCWLEVQPVRVNCPDCGVGVEALDWLEPYARQTVRYEKYVARLCDLLPVLDVCRLEGLDKNRVYRIDRKWLSIRCAQRKQVPVRRLGIDEIAIKKGHRYATVFYDLERREVIGLVESRRERAVGGFFRRWGKAQCKAVEAVCMDLWSPFLNSVQRHCPQAAVVFDKFHVYSYLSEAIEAVRRHEQNLCDEKLGRLMKGTRWLWLKSSESLKRKQSQTLGEIMALNRRMAKAYLLKEDFCDFYASKDRTEAEAFLKGWIRRCRQSRLEPFEKLAKRIKRWSEGILAYFEHRITNGVSEGINNKIKVLKRRAYGFHDTQYFFMKILNATGALPPMEEIRHPRN